MPWTPSGRNWIELNVNWASAKAAQSTQPTARQRVVRLEHCAGLANRCSAPRVSRFAPSKRTSSVCDVERDTSIVVFHPDEYAPELPACRRVVIPGGRSRFRLRWNFALPHESPAARIACPRSCLAAHRTSQFRAPERLLISGARNMYGRCSAFCPSDLNLDRDDILHLSHMRDDANFSSLSFKLHQGIHRQ